MSGNALAISISSHWAKSLNSGGTEPGCILFSALKFLVVLLSILQCVQTCDLSSGFIFLFYHTSGHTTLHHFFLSDLLIFFKWSVSFYPCCYLLSVSAQLVNYFWLLTSFFNIRIYFPLFLLFTIISFFREINWNSSLKMFWIA